MKYSIIIPCYNESKNIPLLLDRLAHVIKRDDIEVVLVNNGSTDDSQQVLDERLPGCKFARTVRVNVNQGYGFGILAGLKSAVGDYLGWTHADLQTDPYDPVRAVEIIEGQEDRVNVFVKGSRKGRPLMDVVFTGGMGVFETLYLGVPLWDINAQPNMFHRSFFESWKNPPHDFSLDLYALYAARRKRLNIIRFPVIFPERVHGSSSWNTGLKAKYRFIKRTVGYSVKLKRELAKWNI